MKGRGVRVLLVVLAAGALAAAGAGVWLVEQRVTAAQAAADTFERDARLSVAALGEWRAAQQAYVAEGQPAGMWLAKAAEIGEAIGPKLSALRAAAGTAQGQGTLESAVEAFASLMQTDARAREYVRSGQRFSASDVIFTEAAPMLEKVVAGVDIARGQERVAHAVTFERLRRWEVVILGAAAATVLIVLLMLVPVPQTGEPESTAATGSDVAAGVKMGGGLRPSSDFGDGIVSRAQPVSSGRTPAAEAAPVATPPAPVPPAPDLDAVAELCASLARVQDTRELQGLLERAAKALDASGVIVWMPDGPQGSLRPVLSHGYAPFALSRMGIIHPAADNATATAYRTKSVVVVPAEAAACGAVVAPLISSEGCSGAMAIELRGGVAASPQARAVATIVASQLATLFTPGAVASAPQTAAAASSGDDAAAAIR